MIGDAGPTLWLPLTRGGRKQLQAETQSWEQKAAIIARFFSVKAEDLK